MFVRILILLSNQRLIHHIKAVFETIGILLAGALERRKHVVLIESYNGDSVVGSHSLL